MSCGRQSSGSFPLRAWARVSRRLVESVVRVQADLGEYIAWAGRCRGLWKLHRKLPGLSNNHKLHNSSRSVRCIEPDRTFVRCAQCNFTRSCLRTYHLGEIVVVAQRPLSPECRTLLRIFGQSRCHPSLDCIYRTVARVSLSAIWIVIGCSYQSAGSAANTLLR